MEKVNYEKLAAENRRLTLEIARDYGRMKRELEASTKRQQHLHNDIEELKGVFVTFLLKSGITEIKKITGEPHAAHKCEKCGK